MFHPICTLTRLPASQNRTGPTKASDSSLLDRCLANTLAVNALVAVAEAAGPPASTAPSLMLFWGALPVAVADEICCRARDSAASTAADASSRSHNRSTTTTMVAESVAAQS